METRINFRAGCWKSLSDKKLASAFVFVCLAGLLSVSFAQGAVTSTEKSASAADANEAISFPYFADITDDGVNIRSGPGTNYYACGKLNKADRVKVVGRRFSWSCIVPPQGSLSWISKQYVDVDKNQPGVGIVTGDSVRVYAGSEGLKPIHSWKEQTKLYKGDKVTLLGPEQDDYYKIVPPSGAYLYVSTQYTKAVEPVWEASPTLEPEVKPQTEPRVEVAREVKSETKPETEESIPVVVPTKIGLESEKLKEYYDLKKQIESELVKPIEQQNYTDIKAALLEIANNKEAGKAARYSEFTLKQIECFELAQKVDQETRLQDKQLQKIENGIEKARDTRLAEVPNLGRFAVIGRLQISNVYGAESERKHYLMMDDSGKIICYALPSGSAANMDLSSFIGRKVGLVGMIEPHPQTSGALVRFTEISRISTGG